tara:strand:+ start:2589 stop:4943 length:2355 start_codon:yes stop_codon:yes gene_type:complete
MGKKEGVTLTDVDALIDLLERRKRISVEDAARQLGTDVSTIENWSNILEEQDLVTTKYSLTTPYLEIKQTKDDKHDGLFSEKNDKVSKDNGHDTVPPQEKQIMEPSLDMVGKELTTPEQEDINGLISQVKALISDGNLSSAKKIYSQIKRSYDSLPVVFLQRKNKIENELIHINNELSISLQRQGLEKIKQGTVDINKLLKQGNGLIKKKDIDNAVQVYNEVKSVYDSLPSGFFSEKTKLAENILKFFQKLSTITTKINNKNMELKTKEILVLVNQIEAFIAQRNVEKAIDVYTKLKKVYSSLPPGYLTKKLDIQEKMINIYRQLMVDKKSILKSDVIEKINTIKQLLKYANDYMKKNDIENGVKSFNEAKAIFEKMPKAFSHEYHVAQQMLLKSYKQLIELKEYVSVRSIKSGSTEILSLIQKSKTAHKNKDYDVAYDLYEKAVSLYNHFPHGFDPKKIEIRTKVYQLYYDVVSGSDFIELGELNPYVKNRYLKLLDLMVTAHEIVDSQQFSMIDQIYNSIYSLYNELPVGLVSKKFLLKQEISRIFEIHRFYHAAINLRKYYNNNDMKGLRFTLNYINQNYESTEKKCYGFVKLVKYVKLEYEKYVTKAYSREQMLALKLKAKQPGKLEAKESPRFVLPEEIPKKRDETTLETEEEERAKIDKLFKLRKTKKLYKAAMKNIKEGDFVTATQALERLQRLEPRNRLIEEKLVEVRELRKNKFRGSITNRLINAKKQRLRRYMGQKNYGSALQEVHTILELDPEDEETQLLLQEINMKKDQARV